MKKFNLGYARIVWAVVLFFTVMPSYSQDNWKQFRGPGARGNGEDNTGLPKEWGEDKNITWKKKVPGKGWASPIIFGNQIIVLTAISKGEEEAPKMGLYFGGERPEPSPHIHDWRLISYDWNSGKINWQETLLSEVPKTPIHVKNSYASETPVTNGEKIISFIGDIGIFAMDMEGNSLWTKRYPPRKRRNAWGSASSPIIHDNKVIIQNDTDETSFIACLDIDTGQTIWRVEHDEPSNWSTPYVWKNGKTNEIITNGRNKVRAYDFDGKVLWEMPGLSTIAIPTPFQVDQDLIVCAGYVGDRKHPAQSIIRVKPGARGNIALKNDESSNKYISWRATRASSYNPTPVAYKNNIYVLFDFGFFNARDLATGKEFYEKERIRRDKPAGFTASPWAYDDMVFGLSEQGETFVFSASDRYQLLRVNKLDDLCMSTPAIARGALIIRSLNYLYKIEEKPVSL